MKSLGMARTAEVKRDARIGEAEARADAQIKEAIAEEQRMASRFLNDTEIAKAQRDFELKKAAYDVEVQTKKAEAELAYELQAAKTKQRIKEEQMQIKVVERTQEIAVQVRNKMCLVFEPVIYVVLCITGARNGKTRTGTGSHRKASG